jgi:UDP-N-acetylglucosamine--N-acetylmuramyl-(pentapeptide) pyrophosphoryl-undecaprenol N-acetylglucosamine transferase
VTTVFVAANGGHLSQLFELAERVDGVGSDRLWVTFDSPQSRSMLRGQETYFIPSIEERDVAGVMRGVGEARRLFNSIKPSAVISTGSAIALSFLPYAALRGIPAHYIESAARVGAPSLTGRVLQFVPGVRLYRQYPAAAKGRWRYAGSVFDGFQPTQQLNRVVRRIVVMLGSGVHSFRRLAESLVACLPKDAEILWQTGSTPVGDLPIAARPLVPAAELEDAVARADVVISHAGCGSALLALNAGKYPILVARRPQNGELVDDHQVELASFLNERGLALARTPDTISLKDVAAVAMRGIARNATPPALRLAQ